MTTGHGALDLLNAYGNDSSSDDEVPSGRVSTKRSYKNESDAEDERTRKVLFLPDIIKLETEEYKDDSSLHDGRIRSFKHERGNWASYVYIPYENNDDIEAVVNNICDKLRAYAFKPINDFHISLTKVVILRHHWITSFVTSIKENLTNINRFILMFDNLNVYCNEERTRTFIGLEIKTGYDSLLNLVGIFNRCLADFRLPEFYENPSFHMSIAWCVGDVEDIVKGILPDLNRHIIEMRDKFDDNNWYIVVNQLHCKIGNKLFTFDIS
ncbi:hypothetical protein MML48_1g03947 [Holotrichia oblita]|uniref:Uncharacterized protein n=1 Tax=Holotrichia oblita TaxID=644536 RepID=A0ACB9TYJ0_HOLOL|nr:hypothetical protein MML48_1g03947 [Holotrichia oblita]